MVAKVVTSPTHLKFPLIVVGEQTCMVFFSELLIAVFPEMSYLALMAPGVKLNKKSPYILTSIVIIKYTTNLSILRFLKGRLQH